MVPALVSEIIGNLKVREARKKRAASEERPHIRERFNMVFMDWSEYFEWCAGGEVDGRTGFKGADVGATKDDVEVRTDEPLTSGLGLAPTEWGEFAVDRCPCDTGVCFRLGVADDCDMHSRCTMQSRLDDNLGHRREERIQGPCGLVKATSFGYKRFLEKAEVLPDNGAHHGAQVASRRSAKSDVHGLLAASAHNVRPVIKRMKNSGG